MTKMEELGLTKDEIIDCIVDFMRINKDPEKGFTGYLREVGLKDINDLAQAITDFINKKKMNNKPDARQYILCPICKTEMVFTRRITPPADKSNLAGLIYRCPTRKDEKGCGTFREVVIEIETNKVI